MWHIHNEAALVPVASIVGELEGGIEEYRTGRRDRFGPQAIDGGPMQVDSRTPSGRNA
ncbi:hypothetical protein GLW36_01545 [Halorubrum terrestre]|uniref:Uncharacterized protein n=1 Tax=Halorubrum distributum TaxID=29283 RepID=A0A6B1IJJ6_9EURY|nr:hypothetical protein [Halorubrum terrestre]MYL15335.1 hypothetical protein [Halorubrum terrestre]